MNQIFKKFTSVFTALVCAAVVTVGGAGVVFAAEETDEALKQTIIQTAEGLTDTIIPLSQDDINNYLNSGDSFTEAAMSAWNTAKEELGDKKESQDGVGETEVSFSNGEYTVTVPAAFEKADANFIYLFDENATPTTMSVDVQYPLSVTLERAGLNTLMGLGTVFCMLVFLSFIIYLFRFIPGFLDRKKKGAEVTAAPVQTAPAAAIQVQETDDTELIAVISAAIAAAEGTSTDGFVVRSIRKVNRKNR